MNDSKDLALSFYPDRRAAIRTAILLAVLVVGWHLPLPGLDLDRMPASAGFSIFALDLLPLFTVLAYVEIAKLAIPPLARWQNASSRNARHLALFVCVLSLALAAWQGSGILLAMDASAIIRPDAVAFVPTGLATLIGSTALIIWLSDRFEVPDLGGGFWLLMAMMIVAGFPDQISTLANLVQVGQISGRPLLVILLSLVMGLVLVVFANKLLSRNVSASGGAKTAILLWPPYLAGVVAGHVVVLLPDEISDWPFVSVSFAEMAYFALMTALIPVFVLAYAGSLLPSNARNRWPLPIVLAIAAIQMVLCLGAWLLPIGLGLPPVIYGSELLVVGTVMLALAASHTPPLPASRPR